MCSAKIGVVLMGVLICMACACVPAHAKPTTVIPEVSADTQSEQSTILLLLLLLD